ncbi:uncharacterized protein EDB91DRAFT_76372 [Suillus paluster]|uniref:uncharacterized protein n=1 Tax=Suillus paluster TaxID=48578 RepID=UPI001B882884|nr:uncharacterized protein EDB91DRAFT_76372 [Suillus paluster]KAG1747244.1 hypothetical protein EDB91DRAFT_76372 [Suillus paluster]
MAQRLCMFKNIAFDASVFFLRLHCHAAQGDHPRRCSHRQRPTSQATTPNTRPIIQGNIFSEPCPFHIRGGLAVEKRFCICPDEQLLRGRSCCVRLYQVPYPPVHISAHPCTLAPLKYLTERKFQGGGNVAAHIVSRIHGYTLPKGAISYDQLQARP